MTDKESELLRHNAGELTRIYDILIELTSRVEELEKYLEGGKE